MMKNNKISIDYKRTSLCLLFMIITNAALMMQAQAFDKNQALPGISNPSLKKTPPPGVTAKPTKPTKPKSNAFSKPAPASTPTTRPPASSLGRSSLKKTTPQPAKKQFSAPKGTTYTAITQKPATRQGLVKVSGANWNCTGNRCTVRSMWSRPTANECKSLARSVGIIQRFGSQRKLLNSNQLKSCNQGIAVSKNIRSGFLKSTSKQPTRFFGNKTVKTQSGISTPAPLTLAPLKNKKTGGFTRKGQVGVNPATQKSAQSLTRAQTPTKPQGSRTTAVKPMARGSLATGSTTGNRVASTSAGQGLARQSQALSPSQLQNVRRNNSQFDRFKNQIFAAQTTANEAAARAARLRNNYGIYGTRGDDCDDNDASVHPNLAETCDHKDNNCNGTVDEGQQIYLYADLDEDTYGDPATRFSACLSDFQDAQRDGNWLILRGGDCDDKDKNRHNDCQ